MMSTNNILSPANGEPIIIPSQDIVLGLYYMTRERINAKGEGKVFADSNEARIAYDHGVVDLQAKAKVRMDGELVETTIGRIIFGQPVARKPFPFSEVEQGDEQKSAGQADRLYLSSCRDEGIR